MIDLNKLKAIYSDTYLLAIKMSELDYTTESWEKRNEMCLDLSRKYNDSLLCQEILKAVMDELSRDDPDERTRKIAGGK